MHGYIRLRKAIRYFFLGDLNVFDHIKGSEWFCGKEI